MAEISSFERMVRPDTVLIVKIERDAFFGSQTVNGSEAKVVVARPFAQEQ